MEGHKWVEVNVYSKDKYERGALELRTARPVVLSKGLSVCQEYEDKGHIVEIRRVV
jgi:hypothetical protein